MKKQLMLISSNISTLFFNQENHFRVLRTFFFHNTFYNTDLWLPISIIFNYFLQLLDFCRHFDVVNFKPEGATLRKAG